MISREKFIAAGRAVHGSNWKSAIARRNGVSRQLVHKWSTGECQIPQYAARRLLSDYFAVMSPVWDFARSLGVKMPRRPPVPDSLSE